MSATTTLYDEVAENNKWMTRQDLSSLVALLHQFYQQAGNKLERDAAFYLAQRASLQLMEQSEFLIDQLLKA